MGKKNRKLASTRAAHLVAAAASVLWSAPIFAAISIWDGGGANSNWDTAANWDANAIPPTSNDVQFATGFGSGATIENHGYRTANSLIINTTANFTIHGDDFGITTLTLLTGNVTRTSSGTATISSALNLGQSGTWNIASAGTLNVTGSVHEQFSGLSLTKTGAGTLLLAGGGAYSGGTFVNQGVLQLQNMGAGTSAINVASGGALELLGATVSNPLVLSGGGASLLSDNAASTVSGPVTLLSSISINTGSELEILGSISDGAGAFNIAKGGSAELILSGPNSFDGSIDVGAGGLVIAHPQALGAGGISRVGQQSVPFGTLTYVRVANNITVNRPLVLSGPGLAESGALLSDAGATWSGPVTLTADSVVSIDNNFTISGDIASADFTVTKKGGGTLNLSGTNSGLQIVVAQGTVALRSSGAAAVAIAQAGTAIELPISVNIAGSVILSDSSIMNPAVLRATGGTSTLNTLGVGANSSVFVASGAQLTLSAVSGSELHKTGAGTLVLAAPAGHTGGTFVEAGTLSITDDSKLGVSSIYVNGGNLLFTGSSTTSRNYPVNGGRLQVVGGATLTVAGSSITGGFLLGPGTFNTNSSANLNGVTALAGSNINVTGPTFLNGFINGGNLSAAGAGWTGGVNASSGKITINSGTLATTAFSNDGLIIINSGGTLQNFGNSLTSGGGSRITINPGGALNLSGNPLDLNGALLVNNGTIIGTTNVNFGSLAKGAGIYGAVNVSDGGRFSPGNSPGSVTTGSTNWNSGGSYLVEIANATAGPGIGWDTWNINGLLDLNATNSSNGKFTISLSTLDGLAANFDPQHDYDWTILHASDSITDFDLSTISLDSSGFKNSLSGGHFSIINNQNDLAVHFSAVPEPILAMPIVAAATLLAARRKK